MNDITKLLNARPSDIRNAPLQFDGHFGDFFDLHVSPNLPSSERIQEFDIRLENYLSSAQPCHLVRKVALLDRRETYSTSEGHILLASDNAPGWWLHAFLLSNLPFPSDMGEFLWNIPRRMFHIKLTKHLNKAAFHLAHLSNVKNGDTNWRGWNKEELERRMRLNIHPWNWSLIAKKNWKFYGANKDILGFIHQEYIKRYGVPYVQWRQRHPIDFSTGGALIPYLYGSQPKQGGPKIKTVATGASIESKRPIIRDEWIAKGVILNLKLDSGNYHIPHDDLHKWVEHNTKALHTESWIRDKVYHWPKPTQKMAVFLQRFRSN